MELKYTKRQFKNGVPVRSIDLRLEALKSFCSSSNIKVQLEALSQKKSLKFNQKNNIINFSPEYLSSLLKALKTLGIVVGTSQGVEGPFPLDDLSSTEKGYLSELCVADFFLKQSYKWCLYRSKKYFSEVDLLFFSQGCYHLVEVKSYTRYSFSMGFISEKQKSRLKKSFLSMQKDYYPLRAHLLSVDLYSRQIGIFFDFLY